jgi:hypothetical protein
MINCELRMTQRANFLSDMTTTVLVNNNDSLEYFYFKEQARHKHYFEYRCGPATWCKSKKYLYCTVVHFIWGLMQIPVRRN